MSPSVLGGASVPDAALAVHSGWLIKKGEGLMASSQKRWFVVYRTGEIHYFDREWSTPEALSQILATRGHKGVVALAGVKPSDISRNKPTSNTDFTFFIATPKRKWVLTAQSTLQYEEWQKAITSVLA